MSSVFISGKVFGFPIAAMSLRWRRFRRFLHPPGGSPHSTPFHPIFTPISPLGCTPTHPMSPHVTPFRLRVANFLLPNIIFLLPIPATGSPIGAGFAPLGAGLRAITLRFRRFKQWVITLKCQNPAFAGSIPLRPKAKSQQPRAFLCIRIKYKDISFN